MCGKYVKVECAFMVLGICIVFSKFGVTFGVNIGSPSNLTNILSVLHLTILHLSIESRKLGHLKW